MSYKIFALRMDKLFFFYPLKPSCCMIITTSNEVKKSGNIFFNGSLDINYWVLSNKCYEIINNSFV